MCIVKNYNTLAKSLLGFVIPMLLEVCAGPIYYQLVTFSYYNCFESVPQWIRTLDVWDQNKNQDDVQGDV